MSSARPWRLERSIHRSPIVAELLQRPIAASLSPDFPLTDEPLVVVASLSGGNDGFSAALRARAMWPNARFIAWHAHIAVMDWHETREVFLRQADALDAEPVVLQAVYKLNGEITPTGMNGTTLVAIHDVLGHGEATTEEYGEDAILNILEFAKRARKGWPPSSKIRYCTRFFKGSTYARWARQNRANLGERSALISGERWAESASRSEVESWEWREDVELQPTKRKGAEWPQGWRQLWVRPVVDWKWHEVNRLCLASDVAFHPGYYIQGETLESMLDPTRPEQGRARLSCRVCVFSTAQAMARAHINAPETFDDAVYAVADYEAETGKTWQAKGPILQLIQAENAAPKVRQSVII